MSGAAYRRVPAVASPTPKVTERLEKLWESGPVLRGFLSTVDHKEIGKAYIVTSFAFLILGGLEAQRQASQVEQIPAETIDAANPWGTYRAVQRRSAATAARHYSLRSDS